MSTMTQDDVVSLVQEFLDQAQPADYRLDVEKAGIRQEEDWWYVTVVPDRSGVRAYDYAHLLTSTEEKLRDQRQINILLVPTLVDD